MRCQGSPRLTVALLSCYRSSRPVCCAHMAASCLLQEQQTWTGPYVHLSENHVLIHDIRIECRLLRYLLLDVCIAALYVYRYGVHITCTCMQRKTVESHVVRVAQTPGTLFRFRVQHTVNQSSRKGIRIHRWHAVKTDGSIRPTPGTFTGKLSLS